MKVICDSCDFEFKIEGDLALTQIIMFPKCNKCGVGNRRIKPNKENKMVKYVKIKDLDEFLKEIKSVRFIYVKIVFGVQGEFEKTKIDLTGSTNNLIANKILVICDLIKDGVYSKKVELKPLTRPEFFEAVADGVKLHSSRMGTDYTTDSIINRKYTIEDLKYRFGQNDYYRSSEI